MPPNGYREAAQGCRSCKEARRKRTRPEPPQYIVHIIDRNYARVAFLNDALRDFDQVEGAIARQFDFSELELGAVRF